MPPTSRPTLLSVYIKSSLKKDLFVNCIVNQPRLPLATCMHYCVSFQDVSKRAGHIYITPDYRSIMRIPRESRFKVTVNQSIQQSSRDLGHERWSKNDYPYDKNCSIIIISKQITLFYRNFINSFTFPRLIIDPQQPWRRRCITGGSKRIKWIRIRLS